MARLLVSMDLSITEAADMVAWWNAFYFVATISVDVGRFTRWSSASLPKVFASFGGDAWPELPLVYGG